MSMAVNILFEEEIKDNKVVVDFVKSKKEAFVSTLLNDESVVIIKEPKESKQTLEDVRMLAGNIVKSLINSNVKKAKINEDILIQIYDSNEKQDVLIAFVEGWNLGTYKYITYKSEATQKKVDLEFFDENAVKAAKETGEVRASAVAFSRDLMNNTANELNPETFPEVLKEELKDTPVEINVLEKADIEKAEMNGLLAVNRGSKYEPRFVELKYVGDDSKPLVALVGKGVTFDTGGISLKSGRDLSDMRMDMGGAAAVSGAIKLLAESTAKVNVIGLLQIVENMPDSDSMLPGDVIRYKNGKTVQVGNTDAEGRLILADGLIRAEELNADYIVNIATLTGAAAVALGSETGAVMGNLEYASDMRTIGAKNGDNVWPLPLIDAYESYLDSDYADFSNISNKGEAGAITAGLFLRRFVNNPEKWLHVDMAGVMESQNKGYYAKSARGYGARLLADYTVAKSE